MSRLGAPALALASGLLAGCPGPEPSGPCGDEDGDPVLVLANRSGGPVLAEGSDVEIFLPPQGGVFTELDVTIDGLAQPELEHLHIVFVRGDADEPIADVRYQGSLIPLRCTADDTLFVDRIPVGFTDPVTIEELDGVVATATGTLETTRGDFSATVDDVVLRAVEF